jgi:hypothetical protein
MESADTPRTSSSGHSSTLASSTASYRLTRVFSATSSQSSVTQSSSKQTQTRTEKRNKSTDLREDRDRVLKELDNNLGNISKTPKEQNYRRKTVKYWRNTKARLEHVVMKLNKHRVKTTAIRSSLPALEARLYAVWQKEHEVNAFLVSSSKFGH